jgi:hypothetical protein
MCVSVEWMTHLDTLCEEKLSVFKSHNLWQKQLPLSLIDDLLVGNIIWIFYEHVGKTGNCV